MGCFSDFGWELIFFFIKGTIFWRIASPKLSNLLETISNHLCFECRYNRSVNFACGGFVCVWFFWCFGGFLSTFTTFSGWWFQPHWKILVKMGIFPKQGWKKNIWNHHLVLECQPHFLAIKSSPQLRLQLKDLHYRRFFSTTLASLAARSSLGIEKKHQRYLEDHPTMGMGTHASFIFRGHFTHIGLKTFMSHGFWGPRAVSK